MKSVGRLEKRETLNLFAANPEVYPLTLEIVKDQDPNDVAEWIDDDEIAD